MSICHAAAFALCVAIVTTVSFAKAAQQTGPAETVRAGATPSDTEADAEHATPSSVPMPVDTANNEHSEHAGLARAGQ